MNVNHLIDEFEKEISRAEKTLESAKEAFDHYRELFYEAQEDYNNAENYLLYLKRSRDSIKELEQDLYGD